MKQKAICLTLVLCLAFLSPCAALALGEDPTQSDFDNAITTKLGKTYTGTFDENGSDYYRFDLKKSGQLNLSLSLIPKYLRNSSNGARSTCDFNIFIYEGTGNKKVVDDFALFDLTEGSIGTLDKVCSPLIAGTYYLRIEPVYYYAARMGAHIDVNCTCDFNLKIKLKSARESFTESLDRRDNNTDEANKIHLNKRYRGQFALNDKKDFYKFKLSKPKRLQIQFISSNSKIDTSLSLRTKKRGVFYDDVYKTSWLPNEWEVDLKAGTYYLRIRTKEFGYFDSTTQHPELYTGCYSFKIKAFGKKARSTSPLEINWPKRSWGDGYYVKIAENKKFTKHVRSQVVTRRDKTTAYFDDLPKGKTYYAKVRPYKKKKSEILNFQWTKLKRTIKFKPWSKTAKITL